jgi:hypothetical protein
MSKPRKNFAAIPIFVRSIRLWRAGAITIGAAP